ncbi:hypothetical protein OH146_04295 [Salinibacterium sp. SYSU T00001]|uniref:hypothetical protein n=1 Tax=Homoserinimonas sedimenticola TaxID=2986805 RepID=UPI0022354356|nr:hypothetical protein [Salinibacterium sedimenticola]MCW4384990.1 hypothetical protein [Salinibacterium sedimenticola]
MVDGTDSHGTPSANPWTPPVEAAASGPAPSPYRPAANTPPPSWTPPSQPGLVPLRPMTLGAILGASFRTLRRNPRPLLGLALSTQFLVGIITAAVMGAAFFWMFSRLENVSAENLEEVTAGGIFALLLSNLVPLLLGTALVALLQGIVVLEVARATIGEKLTLRQLWGRARGRLWALIGWTLLLIVAAGVAIAVLGGLIALFVVLLGVVGVAIGVGIGILGAIGLVVLGVWLGTKLSLVPSALMVERLPLRAAVFRSWQLTDRHFWRTFGIQALVAVILSVAAQVVSTPVSFLMPMLSFIVDPNGTNQELGLAVVMGVYALFLALLIVMTSITTVVQSATNGLIYLDLRMRKEGLELDLSRHVEERDAGLSDLQDPFLPRTSPSRS